MLGELEDYLAGVLAELRDRPGGAGAGGGEDPHRARPPWPQPARRAARRAGRPAARCSRCAPTPTRRLAGLGARTGGFALISYHALSRDPSIAESFAHLVALDPPSSPAAGALLDAGRGFTHLAWGEPELRFAQQMHELEYGLRASLAALYRSLRLRGRVAGEELEHLLRGDGPHGRPARLAARLVQVLAELELVSLDRDLPALAIAGEAPTALERSPAYRVYAQRYEDGRRFLSSANNSEEAEPGPAKDGSTPPAGEDGSGRVFATSRPPVDRVADPCRARGGRARGADRGRAAAARRPVRDRRGARARVRRGRSTASGSRRRSSTPACITPTSAGAPARTSSSIRSAWPRSAPGCGSTPRRCAPRSCTTRSRTPRRRSRRCARRSARRSPGWSTG